jgi:aspartyl aminopeptidase
MNHTISKGDHHMKTLLRFLQNGKTQFHVAALAKEYLDAHNFTQISDRENLTELAAGRYYLAPFSSIVIPFVKGAQSTQVRIACAHTSMFFLSPSARSLTRRWDATREITAMITAIIINKTLIRLI